MPKIDTCEVKKIRIESTENSLISNQQTNLSNDHFDYIRERMVRFDIGSENGLNITERESYQNSNSFPLFFTEENWFSL